MTCKECRFFIQGEGRGGTCEKKPFATAKNGRPHIINGRYVTRYISWGTPACKTFFERRANDEGVDG